MTRRRKVSDYALWQQALLRHAHYVIAGLLALFIIAAVVLGEMLDAYDAFWWWDDMLHGLSGVLFGAIGLALLFVSNRKKELTVTPFFAALFVACFALAMGVVWEIYEFVLDVSFGFTMQQWNMGHGAIVMGESYQGMGLRDTMSDLILATFGASIAAAGTYAVYRWKLPLLRRIMRWSFPLKSSK